MSKGDRNTAITIAVVLIVCLISVIAVGASVWRVIGPGVNSVLTTIGFRVKTSTLDYNFTLPVAQASSSSSSVSTTTSSETSSASSSSASSTTSFASSTDSTAIAEVLPAGYTYNFSIPVLAVSTSSSASSKSSSSASSVVYGFEDAIVDDATLAAVAAGLKPSPGQVDLTIQIPKIGVNAPVLQGYNAAALLRQGFWVHPASKNFGEGEVILLCHRRYFGPTDPRSCWNLDKVKAGDEILLQNNGSTLHYRVMGVNVFNAGDPNIYSVSDTDNYLKISTCTPLGSSAQRLVVLAQRVD